MLTFYALTSKYQSIRNNEKKMEATSIFGRNIHDQWMSSFHPKKLIFLFVGIYFVNINITSLTTFDEIRIRNNHYIITCKDMKGRTCLLSSYSRDIRLQSLQPVSSSCLMKIVVFEIYTYNIYKTYYLGLLSFRNSPIFNVFS